MRRAMNWIRSFMVVALGLLLSAIPTLALTLETVAPNQGVMGQELPVHLTGSGFAANTRLSMTLDSGNTKAIISSQDTPGSALGVTVIGTTAYIADGEQGLRLIDMGNPALPLVIAALDTPGVARGVAVAGTIAYVADGAAGLTLIDISTPAAPAIIATLNTPGSAEAVRVNGATAFVADGTAGLTIIDITTPAAPLLIGTLDTPGTAWSLAVNGPLVYVADGTGGLRIINVTNPAAPVIVGAVATNFAKGVAVNGTLAYVADYGVGLRLIDVADPTAPAIISTVDTPGVACAVTVRNAMAYVADDVAGLQVIDVSQPAAPVIAGSVNTPGKANDVTVTGTMAMVAGDAAGLQIVDVANPTLAVIFGTLTMPEPASAITVNGTMAYIANWGSGLTVADVSQPAQPVAVGSVATAGLASAIAHSGNTAYVLSFNTGLEIIDVTLPQQPVVMGAIATPGGARDVAVAGTLAYVADGDSGLQVIDVTTPASPTVVGTADTPNFAFAVSVQGSMAYVADYGFGLRVIDISDPAAPLIIGSLATAGDARDVKVSGSMAYLTGGNAGLHLIDVGNPAAPVLMATLDTPGYAESVTVNGTKAYVADYGAGLAVIDISSPAAPVLVTTMDTPGSATDVSVAGTMAMVADWWNGVTVIPLPQEITPLTVIDTTAISALLPAPAIPGNYSLRLFTNDGQAAVLPGAVNFTTLDLATFDANALFLQTITGEAVPQAMAADQELDLQLIYKAPTGTPFNLSNLANFPVEWFSSHPEVVAVSAIGHLRAKAPGSAVITAQTPAGKQRVVITVAGVPTPANVGNLIIVAGRKYTDETLSGYFNAMANRVYQTFHGRGFGHDAIYYFNSYGDQFLDDEPETGIVDRLVTPDEKNLAPEITTAITSWAASQENSGPLYLYLLDHGVPSQAAITVAPSAPLLAAQVDAALDLFESASGRPVVVVVESCYSGLWAQALGQSGRIVITSASATQTENLPLDNTLSFSRFFFDALAQGKSLAKALELAQTQTQALSYAASQMPQVASDADLDSAYLAGPFASQGLTPLFTDYSGKQQVIHTTSGQTVPLAASLNMPYAEGFTVWAEITPPLAPGQGVDIGDTPTVAAQKVALSYSGMSDPTAYFGGDKEFAGEAALFSKPGIYDLRYFAENLSGQILVSGHVAVAVEGDGASGGVVATLVTVGGEELPTELPLEQSLAMTVSFTSLSGPVAVQWFSSNPGVLSVTANGEVSALTPGEATITAIYPGGSVSHHMTVAGSATTPKTYGNLLILAGISEKEQVGGGLTQTFAAIAKSAYTTFSNRGFTADDIRYFSPYGSQTLPGTASNIVDTAFTANDPEVATQVTSAITGWAQEQENSGPLYLVLVGHATKDYLLVSPPSKLTIDALDQALDSFQDATGRPVVVMAEACYSGAWLTTLARDNRVVITNTAATPAWLLTNAANSFTGYLLDELSKGQSLEAAFSAASQTLHKTFGNQLPQSQGTAFSALWQSPLVGNYASANGSFFSDYTGKGGGLTVQGGTELTLNAAVTVLSTEGIKLRAQIIPPPPETLPETLLTPTYEGLTVPLALQESGNDAAMFSATATITLPPGPYQLRFILTNDQGEEFKSDPATLTVTSADQQPPSGLSLQIGNGWNLLSSTISIDTAALLGDASTYTSAWAWRDNTWAVYLPGEQQPGGYATAKGFTELATIAPGEGFWLNAQQGGALTIPGTPLSGGIAITSGWNLVGLKGDQDITVADLLSGKTGIVSLWKWESGNWAVRLPDEQDGGQGYATDKGFGLLQAIAPGEGFWVNSTEELTIP